MRLGAASLTAVRRRPGARVGLVLLCLLTAACSPSEHRATTATAPARTQPTRVASALCGRPRVTCLTTKSGLAVRLEASIPGASDLLWEPGGPGLDVTSQLEFLPTWARRFNVVVVPEPWSYRRDDCREPCAGQLDDHDYRELTAAAQRRWSSFEGVVAFSFGAVRVLPLLHDARFTDARFWLAAPAPLPGTDGRTLVRLRLEAATVAVLGAACRPRRCPDGVAPRLGALLAGRLGPSATAARSAVMSLATNAVGNAGFFRRLLWPGHGALSRKDALIVNRAAFTLELRGTDAETEARRRGYLAGVCPTYRWPRRVAAKAGFLAIHAGCAASTAAPPAPFGARARVILELNPRDPVTPIRLQRGWLRLLPPASTVRTYRVFAHTLPAPRAFLAALAARKGD